TRHGVAREDIAIVPDDVPSWLDAAGGKVALHRDEKGRFDRLSTSDSGLHYVRERHSGMTRVLTASELEDFSDPPPCAECGEQFGCEHFNCAGEALLSEAEVEAELPKEWVSFAKDYGVSRGDLERLRVIERDGDEYRVAAGAPTDMRTLELVVLLNEAR
ncbi:MAG TPA: hypothetical protein VF698_10600, partial [Thermoanaerobaculia bacterium]